MVEAAPKGESLPLAAMRRPPACGGLCRAPPGGLPRGRRSLAVGAVGLGGGGAEGESLPLVAMRRPPAYGGLCRPEVGVPLEDCPEVGVPLRWAAVRLGGGGAERGITSVSSDAPPARLRRAVPTGGRRSLAVGAVRLGGGGAERGITAAAAMRRPPACGGLCRPEVGVPLRWGPWGLVGAAPRGESLPLVAMRRPPACGGLCRAPPGGLPRGRRSLAVGAAGLG